jgi:hypothetical protein
MRRFVLCLVLVSGLVGPAASVPAHAAAPAADGPSEFLVRGALLYNFMKFVEWPPSALGDTFVVGVLGDAPVTDIAAAFAGRLVQGRSVTVRPMSESDLSGTLHVLYVASDDLPQLRRVLRAMTQRPVLTVSDIPDARQPEAIINFVALETRVGFQIHLDLARTHALQVSSKLLVLAHLVRTSGPRGATP